MWKKVASKEVHKNPYFSVHEDDVIKPDGSPGVYFVVKPRHGVAVAAYDGSRLLLVNQYRYPLGKRVWSFVAGGAESEDYLQDAKRELEEEAGYSARTWTRVGEFTNNPSMTAQASILFLAEDLKKGDPQREPGELDMEYGFFTPSEVEKFIEKGELSAFDIADYFLIKKYLDL